MVLGNFGPVSTPPKGGHESPAMPSGKIIIVAAVIVLLAAAMFAIFSGGADVSSSGGDGVEGSAGDSGSGGAVVPDDSDSDSSAEFTPTAELTLSNGVVVKTRGLEIVEMPKGQNVLFEDMKTGTMYTHSGNIHTGPHTRIEIVTKKKKLDDISFSVDEFSVSNVRPEKFSVSEYNKRITVYSDMQIPERKKIHVTMYGYNSKNEPAISSEFNIISDHSFIGSNSIGSNFPEDRWKDTEWLILGFEVQNK